MMEALDAPASKSPSRHRAVRRSLSAQPEEPKLSSSPYSTRKSLPGRSLTEYFSHRPDRSSRAGSDDTHVSRRKISTPGTNINTYTQLVPLAEEDRMSISPDRISVSPDRMSISPAYSEVQFDRNPRSKEYEWAGSFTGNFDDEWETPRQTLIFDQRLATHTVSNGGACTPQTIAVRKRQKRVVSSNKSVDKDNLVCWKKLKKIGKIVFCLLTLILSLILILIGISTLHVYQEALCEQRKNSMLPLKKLQDELSEHMIGQDVAISILIDTLKTFVAEKSEVPQVLWLIGSTGTGKTLTTNIIKNTLANFTHIQDIVPSFLPRDTTGLRRVSDSAFSSLDSCSLNLLVTDGLDEENSGSYTLLKNILLKIQGNQDKGDNKGRIVFVLSGTYGSDEVNRHFLMLQASNKHREDLHSQDFASLSSLKGNLKGVSSVSKNIAIVPFLPFDAEGIWLCIKKELQRLNRGDLLQSQDKLLAIRDEVLKHLEFQKSPLPPWSQSGCKRIHSLLILILADIQ